VLLSERFERAQPDDAGADEAARAGALPLPATPLLGRDQDATAVETWSSGRGYGW